jgi:hypothetical protein
MQRFFFTAKAQSRKVFFNTDSQFFFKIQYTKKRTYGIKIIKNHIKNLKALSSSPFWGLLRQFAFDRVGTFFWHTDFTDALQTRIFTDFF